MTRKKMMMDLKIMKKVQEAYSRDGNGHLREKMKALLIGLKIMNKVQEGYGRDGNRH